MRIVDTALRDVKIFEPKVFGDERGFFLETFRQTEFEKLGLDVQFVQDNHSASSKGVLRGLHYQLERPQGKLVRVVVGEVYDVAVDLRRSSPDFGRWVGVYLSAENKKQLWVPPGFAHGFLVTSEYAEFVYKCTDYYCPEDEKILSWDDAKVGVNWPMDDLQVVLSQKDRCGLMLEQADCYL